MIFDAASSELEPETKFPDDRTIHRILDAEPKQWKWFMLVYKKPPVCVILYEHWIFSIIWKYKAKTFYRLLYSFLLYNPGI